MTEAPSIRKNVILDTNVLLHDPGAIFSFENTEVLLPIEVIEEIDEFKRDMTERGRNSRTVAHALDGLRREGRLGQGVPVGTNSQLRVVCGTPELEGNEEELRLGKGVERQILLLALHRTRSQPERSTVVVTKNVNLRLRADALDIEAADYEAEQYEDPSRYHGWTRVEAAPELLEMLRSGHEVALGGSSRSGEFAYLTTSDTEIDPVLGKHIDEQGTVAPLPPLPQDGAVGITPLNVEQRFAMDALLDDSIPLVTLTGKAGTGKTLLAVACGLRKLFAEDRFNRVLVFRPIMPVGHDIGYLPGTIEEKMRPWMQPIYDALELIRELDRRSRKRHLPPDIMECEDVVIEPLTFIRGRSIPHQYIIIDEAQNMTPLEIKTVITRVGKGTKIILTGDPYQIDNPYVDSLSNGLTYLVNKFLGNPMTAHVGLFRGERSELAEAAANIL